MLTLQEIKQQPIPQHIAVIMDGNGRWAKEHGQQRLAGHQQGAHALREVMEGSIMLGVQYLTVYAFSIENWNRSQDEVLGLMQLFVHTCKEELPTLQKYGVCFHAIGNLSMLNNYCREAIQEVEEKTKHNTTLHFQVAISYGSRWEIVDAAKQIAKDVKDGKIALESIDEQLFSNYLQTKNIPDPDLLIRTSGEYRISNYLLWQIAYSELYFTDCYWPDFTKEKLFLAVENYQNRERRCGKTSEQIK